MGAPPAAGSGKFMSNAFDSSSAMAAQAGIHQGVRVPQGVAGLQGPWGTPVQVAAPYTTTAPQGKAAAMAMLASSQPLDVIQQTKFGQEMAVNQANSSLAQGGPRGNGLIPGSHVPSSLGISPPGVPAAPGMPSSPTPSNVYLAKGGPLPPPGSIRQVNGSSHPGMGGMGPGSDFGAPTNAARPGDWVCSACNATVSPHCPAQLPLQLRADMSPASASEHNVAFCMLQWY